MLQRILFVCTGNICRSPTAEAVFRHHVQQQGLERFFHWDSAGTHNYHVGEKADPRTIRTASTRAIEMNDLRARQVNLSDFDNFDLLLAMDARHLNHLQRIAPKQALPKVQLYLPYAGYLPLTDVPDPYYGPQAGFEEVLDMIEAATPSLIKRLQSES